MAFCNGCFVPDIRGAPQHMSEVQARYAVKTHGGYLWGDPTRHMWTLFNNAAAGERPDAVIMALDYHTYRAELKPLPHC